jgi:hypothetical protein
MVANLMNRSGFIPNIPNKTIFSNVYVILIIIIISFIFIGIGLYYMINQANEINIKKSSSYYGKDISLYEPLFQVSAKNVIDCVNMCKNDITCDGITYNENTEECLGTKNGLVREENSNYSSWVKPTDFITPDMEKIDIKKAVLVGFTNAAKNISGDQIPNPYLIGNFAYSFNIMINDFYKNYGYWRHIFHKGTPINSNLTYQSWENLITEIPIQTIGVWLAPFTNNIRIAITTTSESNKNSGNYPDAFIQKCNNASECYITDMPSGKWVDKSRKGDGSIDNIKLNTYIEYVDQDLQNVPVNRKVNITINCRGKYIEIYFDGKIIKTTKLDGMPNVNKLGLYVMNEKTFGGEISNLLYYPDALKLNFIKQISDLKNQ